MDKKHFRTFQVRDESFVIKTEPIYAEGLDDFAVQKTNEIKIFSTKVTILYQNQLIYATFYHKSQCFVFVDHPKKTFKQEIPLIFRLLKEVFGVRHFLLQKQFQDYSLSLFS